MFLARRHFHWVSTWVLLLCLLAAAIAYQRKAAEVRSFENNLDHVQSDNAKFVKALKAELITAKTSKEELSRSIPNSGKPMARPSPQDQFELARKDPAFAARLHKRQLRDVQRRFGDVIGAMGLGMSQRSLKVLGGRWLEGLVSGIG